MDSQQFKKFSKIFLIGLTTIFLQGCLSEPAKEVVASSGVSEFVGADTARNLGGSILISWTVPLTEVVSEYRIYGVQTDGSMALIDSVDGTQTSYTVSGLTKNKAYSFIVRRANFSNQEDSNKKVVSAVAFEGLQAAVVTGQTTAKVYLPGTGGDFNEVRIYAQSPFDSDRGSPVAVVSNTTSYVELTGLKSGVAYQFNAQAFNSSIGAEDGNTLNITGETESESFSGADFKYRGFILAEAYGNSPSAPRAPTAKMVRLTWENFAGTSADAKYRVFRVGRGSTKRIDVSTTTACSSISAVTDDPCMVCEIAGNSCTDTNIADAPHYYLYGVSIVKTRPSPSPGSPAEIWVEDFPSTNTSDYLVDVAVPPDNMVLVQRDSVNREVCNLLGQTSDPKFHNRCTYQGFGKTPKNSGPGKPDLNLDPAYFDFGYNLFIDRYELACNWTRASNGGKCGPGGSTGDCVSSVISGPTKDTQANDFNWRPDSSMGVNGNIFWAVGAENGFVGTYPSRCYIKSGGVWRTISDASLTTSEIASMVTVDPGVGGGQRPPLRILNTSSELVSTADKACSSPAATPYGKKRMLRMREWRAAAAWPIHNLEPNYITPAQQVWVEGGWSNLPGYRYCNTQAGGDNAGYVAGRTYPYPVTSANMVDNVSIVAGTGYPNELTRFGGDTSANDKEGLNGGNRGEGQFFIGSHATMNCISRYGAQDMIGNTNELVSDTMSACDSSTKNCAGVTSDIDSGNNDINGLLFGGTGVWNWNSSPLYSGKVFLGPSGFSYFTSSIVLRLTDGFESDSTYAWNQNTSSYTINLNGNSFQYFNPVLGLPYASQNDSGWAVPKNRALTYVRGTYVTSWNFNSNSAPSPSSRRYFAVGGGQWPAVSGVFNSARWSTELSSTGTARGGVRCGVPAD